MKVHLVSLEFEKLLCSSKPSVAFHLRAFKLSHLQGSRINLMISGIVLEVLCNYPLILLAPSVIVDEEKYGTGYRGKSSHIE